MILYALILLCSSVLAQSASDPCFYMLQAGASFCPDPKTLRYNPISNYWEGDDAWRSVEKSFSKDLTTFVGTQWRGTNLGRVVCIYRGSKKGEFPVQVSRDTLVHSPAAIIDRTGTLAPNTRLWQPDEKRSGALNCFPRTGSVCDCPFYLYEKPKLSLEEEVMGIEKYSGEDAWMYI